MTVGRNDPCPCGSGRKYKHCCLQAHDLVEARWLAWRQAEAVVVPAVDDFAMAEWGEALVEEALETCFKAAAEAPLSFAAVTGVEPGRSIDLRDILTGETHRVLERRASSSLQPGDVILARVVTDGDVAVMSGLGPYPLAPSDHNRVIDFRGKFLRARGSVGRASVKSRSLEVIHVYRQLVEQALNPRPLELRNTDGDRLEPTILEFELRCGVREAFDRLASLSVVQRADDMLDDATWSDARELTEIGIDWGKRGNRQHRDWDNTTLGNLTLTAGAIRVSVNSVKRARKIRGLIEKRLDPDVLYLRQTIESMDALLDPSRRDERDGPEEPKAQPIASTPEGRACVEEMNRRHWDGWLGGKVPALGNITPRQAAKTPLGRERLGALLAEFSWRQEASPNNLIRVDIAWIRRELNLTDEP